MFKWPNAAAWQLTALCFIGFAVLATSFGLATGLYTYAPLTDIRALFSRVTTAFIVPGLLEELVFRGPLIWLAMQKGRAPIWAIILSLLAFILWHPFNATVYLTQAQDLFFDWRFLTVAAGLGGVVTYLAVRTRSLWPPVMFHWLAVTGWIVLLGAPDFF